MSTYSYVNLGQPTKESMKKQEETSFHTKMKSNNKSRKATFYQIYKSKRKGKKVDSKHDKRSETVNKKIAGFKELIQERSQSGM